MAQISTSKPTTQKPVTQKKDRLWGALWAGGKTVAVSFAKTGYALWLEVTGMLFAVFAVGGGSALVKQYLLNHFADRQRFWRIAIFTAVCIYFTVVSFVRAKRMRK